jgi:hypothetical protein
MQNDHVSLAPQHIDRDAAFVSEVQESWRTLKGMPTCGCTNPKLKLLQTPIHDMRLDPDVVGSYCFFECKTCETVFTAVYGDDGVLLNAFDLFDLVLKAAVPDEET